MFVCLRLQKIISGASAQSNLQTFSTLVLSSISQQNIWKQDVVHVYAIQCREIKMQSKDRIVVQWCCSDQTLQLTQLAPHCKPHC